MRDKNRSNNTSSTFSAVTATMFPWNHLLPMPEPEPLFLPEPLDEPDFDWLTDLRRIVFAVTYPVIFIPTLGLILISASADKEFDPNCTESSQV